MVFCVFKKKKYFECCFGNLSLYQNRNSSFRKPFHCTFIALIIIIQLCYCLICNLFQIITDFETFGTGNWSFGYTIYNKIWKRVLVFYVQFADFAFCTGFSFYLTICISILFYRCSEILSGYKNFLRICLQKRTSKNIKDSLLEFFYIVKLLRKLNKTFHTCLCLLLFSI